jgi:hypothetical protein
MSAALAVEEPPATSIRTRLTAISPELADDAEKALREALKSTKRVRANRECVKCGCTHVDYVDVQDAPKVLEAIKLAIEQTEGRPGVADSEQAEALTVERTVYTAISADQALALLDAGDLEQLRAELLSSLTVAPTVAPHTT